jgi:hypothetical protein
MPQGLITATSFTAANARASRLTTGFRGLIGVLSRLWYHPTMPIRFAYNPRKANEALLYIASRWPEIDVFHASKVIFFAEEDHINVCGQPIIGDILKALPYGPAPQHSLNSINRQLNASAADIPFDVVEMPFKTIVPKREPDLNLLSPSDIISLDRAIEMCRGSDFNSISRESHLRDAWRRAPKNGEMDYEELVRPAHPHREALLNDMREFAAYGVL